MHAISHFIDLAADVKLLAMKMIKTMIEASKPVDFQLLIPGMLTALLSTNKQIRLVALEILDTVASKYQQLISDPKDKKKKFRAENVYRLNAFYGTSTSSVQFLTPTNVLKIVQEICARRTTILLDSNHVAVAIGELARPDAKGKLNEYASF